MNEPTWIYFDYSATAPLRPEAREALLRLSEPTYANASSLHTFGRSARRELTKARRTIGSVLGFARDEVTFTGNGSEANLLALVGTVRGLPADRRHVLASSIEHPSVLEPLRTLAAGGEIDLVLVPVDRHGFVDPGTIEQYLQANTGLVTVMAANNEIGTIQPIAAIADKAHSCGALMHTDAAQAVGKLPLTPEDLPVDLLTISPHKCGGPRGVGVLCVRDSVVLQSPLSAGRQEQGLRGGTEDVAHCVAAATAIQLSHQESGEYATQLGKLQSLLCQELNQRFSDIVMHSPSENVLPGIVNFSLPKILGAWLVAAMDQRHVAISSGSACSSLASVPSHVLEAIGAGELARCSVRISMGRGSSESDVHEYLSRMENAVTELRHVAQKDNSQNGCNQ